LNIFEKIRIAFIFAYAKGRDLIFFRLKAIVPNTFKMFLHKSKDSPRDIVSHKTSSNIMCMDLSKMFIKFCILIHTSRKISN
jgi:hypothetical protein